MSQRLEPNRAGLTPADASNIEFWRQLCPEFSIEGAAQPPPIRLPDLAALARSLRDEGYVNTPDVFPREHVARLSEGIRRFTERGIPAPFAFVYDEYWLLFRSLAPFLSAMLGERYRVLPDLWAWYVLPANDAAGWVPHRDRSAATLQPDNTPNSLTVWLPLTDSTPLNGCMYVLPAHLDRDLHTPSVSDKNEFNFTSDTLQNIRALPATAGSLLAWNHSLVHWGGRASNLGATPRCSIALQFQRAEAPPLEPLQLDPQTIPPFPERIGLIGHLISLFSGFLPLRPETKMLGAALEWKYWKKPAR